MKEQQVTWRFALEPATGEDVAQLEKRLGVRLPTDYLECAITNHGGNPQPKCLDFGGKHDRTFDVLLSLIDNTEEQSVMEAYQDIGDRIPGKLVPFAANAGGDYYCFDYRESAIPKIVYWDHEKAFRNPAKAVCHVADSFIDMLHMLHDPRE